MHLLLHFFSSLVALFFPRLCASCNAALLGSEDGLCTTCLYELPYTPFHQDRDNRMARQLWGRVPVLAATALFYFRKGSGVQHVVHRLKYKQQPQLGNLLGKLLAHRLRDAAAFGSPDLVVPVPLHPLREKARGYNQSAHFAAGIGGDLGLPVLSGNLLRQTETQTQTRKSRFSRYENMKDVFTVRDPEVFTGKHLLLADDVLTTGATVEACCIALLAIPGVRVSVATIAYAE